ncbi:Uncharacterized protein FWK35_00026085 [Aphis craccivora]|uniref:Uncharacterized protein n=1 Tax=Aphis craccivora TaxID=307492 RepID=A0A6G0ZP95_APHCR|nr:Uncharacterized protein FWK35_00026085 [Aphis craccivora]
MDTNTTRSSFDRPSSYRLRAQNISWECVVRAGPKRPSGYVAVLLVHGQRYTLIRRRVASVVYENDEQSFANSERTAVIFRPVVDSSLPSLTQCLV